MILFGASGHCKSVIDIAESIGEKINLIIDDNPALDTICSIPVKKYSTEFSFQQDALVISIGNNKIRKAKSSSLHCKFGQLIHKSASVSKYAILGEGSVVMANAVINAAVNIGTHCIINSGAVIEHDCSLEDFVHISPNASLAGGVYIGEGTHIGIGACVLPGVKIGKWATVGAGAVILKDVPDGAVVVGNPGRVINP